MMTNQIFEQQNLYFDVMFQYVNNTFLSPISISSIYNRNKYTQSTQVRAPTVLKKS